MNMDRFSSTNTLASLKDCNVRISRLLELIEEAGSASQAIPSLRSDVAVRTQDDSHRAADRTAFINHEF
jgi:hypothetical protein